MPFLLAMLYNVTITQKYLEVSHTQMEIDSMHARIEKKLKNQTINISAEYITVYQKAKKTKAYHVNYLTHTYFKSFKDLNLFRSIRPGKLKGVPKVSTFYLLIVLQMNLFALNLITSPHFPGDRYKMPEV